MEKRITKEVHIGNRVIGGAEKGSITGLYTELVDGEDFNEPITDTARSILDGHIMLTRKLANKNHYPAIDVLQSISRVMNSIATKEHNTAVFYVLLKKCIR